LPDVRKPKTSQSNAREVNHTQGAVRAVKTWRYPADMKPPISNKSIPHF